MQAKTIALILKIAEIISNILVSTRNHNKGGNKNDQSGSSQKK